MKKGLARPTLRWVTAMKESETRAAGGSLPLPVAISQPAFCPLFGLASEHVIITMRTTKSRIFLVAIDNLWKFLDERRKTLPFGLSPTAADGNLGGSAADSATAIGHFCRCALSTYEVDFLPAATTSNLSNAFPKNFHELVPAND